MASISLTYMKPINKREKPFRDERFGLWRGPSPARSAGLARVRHTFEAFSTRQPGAPRQARDRKRLITPERDAAGLPAGCKGQAQRSAIRRSPRVIGPV
jgi:hypothetical protein